MSGRVSDTGTLAIEEVDTDDMRTRRLKTDHARSRQAMRKRCSPPPSDLLVVQSGSESGGLRECRIHADAVALLGDQWIGWCRGSAYVDADCSQRQRVGASSRRSAHSETFGSSSRMPVRP
jgi:hypothetical protein